MSAPTRPAPQPPVGTCTVCGQPAMSVVTDTAIAEQYADGSIGTPNTPGKVPAWPTRLMVPGETRTRYLPCGHDHECDQEALVVIFDDGVPDHEVCPVCGKAWRP